MKYSRPLLIFAAILALVLLVSAAHSQKTPGPAYKSVHLLKLTSPKAEVSLGKIVGELNKLYEQLGYPNIRYRAWKISGKQSGQFTHIWESEWPDKATYDKAHEHKELIDLDTRYKKEIEELEKDALYNRFEELPVGAIKK